RPTALRTGRRVSVRTPDRVGCPRNLASLSSFQTRWPPQASIAVSGFQRRTFQTYRELQATVNQHPFRASRSTTALQRQTCSRRALARPEENYQKNLQVVRGGSPETCFTP